MDYYARLVELLALLPADVQEEAIRLAAFLAAEAAVAPLSASAFLSFTFLYFSGIVAAKIGIVVARIGIIATQILKMDAFIRAAYF